MGLRRIEAIEIDGVIDPIEGEVPEFIWVDPCEILIEDEYQREPSKRSLGLVRRAAKAFSWRKFTPPKVVRTAAGLVATDGQHTGIMAATRAAAMNEAGFKIPVQVITAGRVEDRALAFVGQNADRTGMTGLQMHRAKVAAGDEEALTVEQVCARAGVKICAYQKPVWDVGDTVAVAAIGKLVGKRFAAGARRVLEVLVQGGVKPIDADMIKAVEQLLFAPEFKGNVKELTIVRVLSDSLPKVLSDAGIFAATHRVRKWKAVTATLYQACARAKATL